jgi:hypothetical protein
MPLLHDWQNFYMLTGAAAATLIGLLFIAISIGSYLPTQRAADSLQTFITPTLLNYSQVLLISCLAVMPILTPPIFGIALAILGCFNIASTLQVLWRMRIVHSINQIDFGHWTWHFLLPLIAGLLFVGTAIGFFLAKSFAFLGLSITDLLCLAIGLRNTWVSTVWLALHREQQR